MKIKCMCITIKETISEQIKKGRIYYLDLDTLFSDNDGDWYADVYEGADRIGSLNINHFKRVE